MIDSIVEEMGEENVIQVVTNNATNYEVVGHLLMTKRKKAILDIVCCTYCVDLMLEDYVKKIPIHGRQFQKVKNYYLYLFKIFSNFSITTFHKRNGYGKVRCYHASQHHT